MTLYTSTLPSGKRLISPSFRKLFFVCCGFAWKPFSPGTAEMTITETTFEVFLREWAAKIEQGKTPGVPHA